MRKNMQIREKATNAVSNLKAILGEERTKKARSSINVCAKPERINSEPKELIGLIVDLSARERWK